MMSGVRTQPGHLTAADTAGFRIVSPRNGDRYQIPPGVPARYATVALVAAGSGSEKGVSWFVDGRPAHASRLTLQPGTHSIRAVAGGRVHDEVRVVVE